LLQQRTITFKYRNGRKTTSIRRSIS